MPGGFAFRSTRFTIATVNSRAAALALVLACPASVAPAAEADGEIPTIDVTDRRDGSNTIRALGLPLERRLLPIAVDTIDSDLIELAAHRDLARLIDLTGAALSLPAEGGAMDEIIVRGFGDTPFFRNGLNDSLGRSPPRSLANVARVEILKGPNAALFGPGEPGGAINLVTHQPERDRSATLSSALGRFGQLAFTADATGAVPRRENWQYRLISERSQGDTFREFVNHDRWFVAPSLAWEPVAGSRLLLGLEYAAISRVLDPGIFLSAGRRSVPRSRFLGEPAAGNARNRGATAQLSASTALTGGWTLELQGQVQRSRLVGAAVEPAGFDDDQLLRELQRLDETTTSWITQLEAAGTWHLAALRHDLVMGLELTGVRENTDLRASDSDSAAFAIDPYAPTYGLALPPTEPERLGLERRRQRAAYVRDVITFDARWRALIAARIDHIDQRGRDAVSGSVFDDARTGFSPRASLVWDSMRGAVLYASYSRSLDPNEGLQPDGRALVPTRARALEAGLRVGSTESALALDAALFTVRQRNVAVDAPGQPGFEIQTARQDNLGADLELVWRPARGSEVRLRYNWLDSKISDDPEIADGADALNVPRHQAGVLALWRTSLRRADDVALGMALNVVGRRAASLDPDAAGLELDAYLRLDLFARWRASPALELLLDVGNLTDSHYIQGSQSDALSLTPGAPRAVRAELRLHF